MGKRKALMKASELREKRKKRREQLEVLLSVYVTTCCSIYGCQEHIEFYGQ